MKLIILIFVIFFLKPIFANNIGVETGLELPRYVSLKSNDSNIRIGPSKNYPIIIKYIVSDLPLIVIDEYENWRKIIDVDNNSGWIHKSLIKGERSAIINAQHKNLIKIYNVNSGKIIGEIANGTIVIVPKCKLNWCLISKYNKSGWIKKKYLWGVKKDEKFNINFLQSLYDFYYQSINLIDKYLKK